MIQVGRVEGEVCSVLAAWCGKVMLTGMQFLRKMSDRKMCFMNMCSEGKLSPILI